MQDLLGSFQTYFQEFYIRYFRVYDERFVYKTLGELYILFLISVPLSLLLYLLFNRHRSKMLVDLGFHKWLIKS
jgi:hypothetical protein